MPIQKCKAAQVKPGDVVFVPGDRKVKGDWIEVWSIEGKCPRDKIVVLHHQYPDRYFEYWKQQKYDKAMLEVRHKLGAIHIARCDEVLRRR